MQRFPKYLFFTICLAFFSCSKDKLDPPALDCVEIIVYKNEPKSILNKSCAYSGCHVPGYSSGDFSSYDAMLSRLENGKFEKEVLNNRSMPPSNVPDGKPKSLTEEELRILRCWASEGYPNN